MIPHVLKLSKKWQKYTLLQSIAKHPDARYSKYRQFNKVNFRYMFPFADKIACDLLAHGEIELALRLNAEICFSKGTGYIDLQWRDRIFLVGLLAAYTRNFSQAAEWLAYGVNETRGKIINRSFTSGYSTQFISWVQENKTLITTAQGWKQILTDAAKTDEGFTLIILRISTIADSLNLKDDVTALIQQIDNSKYQDWVKVLLHRKISTPSLEDMHFTPKETWHGSYGNIVEKIKLNSLSRIFSKQAQSQEFFTDQEYKWLIENNYGFISSPQFSLLCQAGQQLSLNAHKNVVTLLQNEIDKNTTFYDNLRAQPNPLKVFVGGYGWTGSGAVFDSFRGYPEVSEMPGAGKHVAYLNKGAESEPMLHQGPAGILAFANQIQNSDGISIDLWKQFFRLYIFTDLPRNYFEYKTIHANQHIRSQVGSKPYYLLMIQFIHALSKALSLKTAKLQQSASLSALGTFEGNVIKLLFKDNPSIVIFNNAINTHNVTALEYLEGRLIYIAVNRNILDQLADQRKSNIFFNTPVTKFAKIKAKKIRQYFSFRKKLERRANIEFYNIQFEDWVHNKKYRSETTIRILGTFSPEHDEKFFTPSQSSKNIGIYDKTTNAKETKLLNTLQRRNKHL